MTELNERRIRWIVRYCAELKGFSTREVAEIYGISQRRVQQILNVCRETGEVPMLKKNRRPKTRLTEEQERRIEEVWRDEARGQTALL